MSALGQKQTYAVQHVMSGLPPKADMCGAHTHVCFGPIADSCKSPCLLYTRKRTHAVQQRMSALGHKRHFRDVATALLSMDSISANSDCCSGRDTRSLPLNLDYYRGSKPHPLSRDTEKVTRRWLHQISFCL